MGLLSHLLILREVSHIEIAHTYDIKVARQESALRFDRAALRPDPSTTCKWCRSYVSASIKYSPTRQTWTLAL